MNNKKLAVVTTTFPALSQTFVIEQVSALCVLGVVPDIIARSTDERGDSHAGVVKHGLLAHTVLTPEYAPGGKRATLKRACFFAWEFLRGPVSFLRLRDECRRRYPDEPQLFPLALQWRHRPAYNYYLCHFGQIGRDMVRLRSLLKLPGKVYTIFHGADVSRYVENNGRDVYNELFEQGELFLPVSDFWKSRLTDLGCAPEKISVLHVGIDLDAFPYSKPQTNDVFSMLSVSRLVEKKGIRYAIDALAQLKQEHPEQKLKYTVIGDGPLSAELQQQAADAGLGDVVEFLGPQPNSRVQEELKRTNLLLAPSVVAADGDMEGIPVALMEAMATGIPVVSTWHSGIPELVIHEQTGLLAEERNAADLAAQIARLIKDPDYSAQLSEAGRRHVELEHNNEVIAKLLQALVG